MVEGFFTGLVGLAVSLTSLVGWWAAGGVDAPTMLSRGVTVPRLPPFNYRPDRLLFP